MPRWDDLPLPDGSYSDDSKAFTDQDVVNYLPTLADQSGTRSRVKYRPTPGLDPFTNVGGGPHRGGRDVEGRAFVVSGSTLYEVKKSGTTINIGTIPGTGLVSMTHNQINGGNEVVIGTGDNSYVFNTVTEELTANGVGLSSVDFLNQLVIGVEPQRRRFRWSGLADATSYNDTDNESAESSPDRIAGGITSNGEYLVFGERTIEPWAHQPTASTAFQRQTGLIQERGCLSGNTLARLDNTVFFVDNQFIPCRLVNGYSPQPIAPKAIVDELRQRDPRKMFAYTWEDAGYAVYYLTCKDGRTWGFDVTSGKWHRRESFGLNRWRLNTLFKWDGEWYGGDYSNGTLYKLRWHHPYENDKIISRRIRTGVMHDMGNRVEFHGLKVLMETGRPIT